MVRYGLEYNHEQIVPFAVYHESGEKYLLPGEQNGSNSQDELYQYEPQSDIPIAVRFVKDYRHLYTNSDPSLVRIIEKQESFYNPPLHSLDYCSLCSGEFSLHRREPLEVIECPSTRRKWDFHWNIAPQDRQGHFLIVPTMTKTENCRAQDLLQTDVEDILDFLLHSIDSQGVFYFNSIGAGASQNHIHCHFVQTALPIMKWEPKIAQFPEQSFDLGDGFALELFVRTNHHLGDCHCTFFEFRWSLKIQNDLVTIKKIASRVYHLLEVLTKTENRVFNLLASNNRIMIFVRKFNEAQLRPFSSFGSGECSGLVVCSSKDKFEQLYGSVEQVCRCLGSVLCPLEDYHRVLMKLRTLWDDCNAQVVD